MNGVANPGFTYDADGNLTAGAARSATWTSFNMPATLTQGSNSDAYLYGPEHQRIKETRQDASYVLFFGLGTGEPHYEKYVNGSAFNYRYYLYADGGMVGVVNEDPAGTRTTRYFHRDHLGSVAVITNDSGAVTEKLSYDAWGKRRNANGTDAAGPITSSIDRGYTGHEMLDSIGLVHMNGRIYDPTIGRVLSADPTVQAPGATQSYNRYTYVGNNPLSAVDPSGYVSVIHSLAEGGGGGGGRVARFLGTEFGNFASFALIHGSADYGDLSAREKCVGHMASCILDGYNPRIGAFEGGFTTAPDLLLSRLMLGYEPGSAPAQVAATGSLVGISTGTGYTIGVNGDLASLSASGSIQPLAANGAIIYKRTGPNGECYIGSTCSASRYIERQAEHDRETARANEYEIIDENVPEEQRRFLEEKRIREAGGPSNREGGTLENRRYEMNDPEFLRQGGTIPKPTGPRIRVLPGLLNVPGLIIDFIEFNKMMNDPCYQNPFCA